MTTTPTDRSKGPTGFRRHSYESQCRGKRPYSEHALDITFAYVADPMATSSSCDPHMAG